MREQIKREKIRQNMKWAKLRREKRENETKQELKQINKDDQKGNETNETKWDNWRNKTREELRPNKTREETKQAKSIVTFQMCPATRKNKSVYMWHTHSTPSLCLSLSFSFFSFWSNEAQTSELQHNLSSIHPDTSTETQQAGFNLQLTFILKDTEGKIHNPFLWQWKNKRFQCDWGHAALTDQAKPPH